MSSLLENTENLINHHQLFKANNTVIVAVSGGKDSMVLLHLLQCLKVKIIVAHVNFQLRGEESNGDQIFVRDYCQNNQILCETVAFNTTQIASENKLSIQIAARELRYSWFEKLRIKHKAVAIATAHHANDNLETILFNFTKGTGIDGIVGMKPKYGYIIRPLLYTSNEEINQYCIDNKILYREDSSNASNKYDRNKIRHEVIPVLAEINTSFIDTINKHNKRWLAISETYNGAIAFWNKRLLKRNGKTIKLAFNALTPTQQNAYFLYDLLEEFGFSLSDLEDALQAMRSNEPKIFLSKNYRLLKDKKHFVISPIQLVENSYFELISKKKKKIKLVGNNILHLQHKPIEALGEIKTKSSIAYLDFNVLSDNLFIRNIKQGDYFYPLGLQKKGGQAAKKKVNKFLNDLKVSAHEKEQALVLCDGDKIVWLINYRIDQRFAINSHTKNVWQLKINEQ